MTECPECNGLGFRLEGNVPKDRVICKRCDGRGIIAKTFPWAIDHEYRNTRLRMEKAWHDLQQQEKRCKQCGK